MTIKNTCNKINKDLTDLEKKLNWKGLEPSRTLIARKKDKYYSDLYHISMLADTLINPNNHIITDHKKGLLKNMIKLPIKNQIGNFPQPLLK